MKPLSGSKKTNPNKANFKPNLAKMAHHEKDRACGQAKLFIECVLYIKDKKGK
jgi:hypothetical protein